MTFLDEQQEQSEMNSYWANTKAMTRLATRLSLLANLVAVIKPGYLLALGILLAGPQLQAAESGRAMNQAVKLGKLTVNSTLGENLDADIELVDMGEWTSDQVLPRLASKQDFNRLRMTRTHELTMLKFDAMSEGDRHFVKVTSEQPQTSPFLAFVVDLIWPAGRTIRVYTVSIKRQIDLADATRAARPSEAQGGSPGQATSSPGRQSPRAGSPDARVAASSASNSDGGRSDGGRSDGGRSDGGRSDGRSSQRAQASSRAIQDMSSSHSIVTQKGDTLWSIAVRVRPDRSVTVQETVEAIRRANLKAFRNGNIDYLFTGQRLRIPDLQEIMAANRRGASSPGEPGRQSRSQPSAGQVSGRDELKLLVPDRATGNKIQQLERDLALTREDLDSTKRNNIDLQTQLVDLARQLFDLDELLKLKDEQIAASEARVLQIQASQQEAEDSAPGEDASEEYQSVISQHLEDLLSDIPYLQDFPIPHHPLLEQLTLYITLAAMFALVLLVLTLFFKLITMPFRSRDDADDYIDYPRSATRQARHADTGAQNVPRFGSASAPIQQPSARQANPIVESRSAAMNRPSQVAPDPDAGAQLNDPDFELDAQRGADEPEYESDANRDAAYERDVDAAREPNRGYEEGEAAANLDAGHEPHGSEMDVDDDLGPLLEPDDDDDYPAPTESLADEGSVEGDVSSNLDLARAYLEMGNFDEARTLLEQVMEEGDEDETHEASGLLQQIDQLDSEP